MQSLDITLRHATKSDSRLLWEWANDPIVRTASFSIDLIPWKDHEKWFEKKLNDRNCKIYIAEKNNIPIGQIRFDCKKTNAMISISLCSKQIGKGFGTKILKKGVKKFINETDIKDIHAYIKIDNEASCKLFKKVGFNNFVIENMKGYRIYHCIFKKLKN